MAKRELFSGRFRQAHVAAQQALKEGPRAVEAALVMAAIAIEHGNVPGGEKLCAIVRDSGSDSCWLNVLEARIALLRQNQEMARKHAIAAHSSGTDDPHIANQLGVVLSRTGWHSHSIKPFGMASEAHPEHPDYRYNYAVALQFAGRLEDAELQFRELVKQAPDHASGWLALVQLATNPDADWSEVLVRKFETSDDPDQSLLIGHALARISENEKDWDGSFHWLKQAKDRKKSQVDHDRAWAEDLVEAAIDAANAHDQSERKQGDERPIFVVGMPRSGTTLIERILTSHSQVTSVGELSDFAIVLKQFLKTQGAHVLDPALVRAASAHSDLPQVGAQYLERAGALAGDAGRFIDKMPFNSFFVPAILTALPEARVICLRRSPHDLAFANFRQLFATGFSYYSYAYDIADTAHFIAQFERMADHYEATLPQDRFATIRYEDVIADQRGQTERLLEFCGLDWEEACMEFHRNAEPVATASSVQVRSPLYSSSLGQWRRYSEGGPKVAEELSRYGIEPDE